MPFSYKKFITLPLMRQHKKCAEMLRNDDLQSYKEVAGWLDFPCPKETSEAISNRYHEHMKQAGRTLKEHNLLPRITKEDRKNGEEPWPIVIFLDQLRSAHNVGSILRTIEALRLGTVALSKDTPGPDSKQVQNTSMGAWQWVGCEKIELENLPRPIIALETSLDAEPLDTFVFPQSFTLVVGNEEFGLSEKSLGLADHLVQIPLRGRKNSLNVACAFAMAAQEIASQRRDYAAKPAS